MRAIFLLYDKQDAGKLTKSDFLRISNELNLNLTRDRIEDIFERASEDGQYITFDDFKHKLEKTDNN